MLADWYDANPDSAPARADRVQQLMGRDPDAAWRLLGESIALLPGAGSLRGLQAFVLERQGKAAEAEAAMRLAAELDPDNPGFHAVQAAAEVERDPSAALEHWLSAYFADPHFALGEPASVRVKQLAFEVGSERYEMEANGCPAPECLIPLLADDSPVVVTLALRRMEEVWRRAFVEPLVALMGHDDPDLREKAASALRRQVGPDFDGRLRQLLKDPDLRRRGLAGFLALRRWGDQAHPVLLGFLDSDVEILRRDAVRALVADGGEGARALLRDHVAEEPQPALRAEIEAALSR